ncbi:MAG: hypothetical protein HW415_732 [Deltaproteobacteria bacterium]|nr:hypothetical protein [Deltaproteobacteria bacterium]
MPINYRIDLRQNMIWTTVTGILTDGELLEHKQKIVRDPDFRPGMRELSDVRNVEQIDITSEGVQRFVAQDADDVLLLRNHRIAIVAQEDVVFGMARMYAMMTEKYLGDVMVFRDMEDAIAWLGIEEQG